MSFNGVWFTCNECKANRRCGPHGARPRGWKTYEHEPGRWWHICTRCKEVVKWRDAVWVDEEAQGQDRHQ